MRRLDAAWRWGQSAIELIARLSRQRAFRIGLNVAVALLVVFFLVYAIYGSWSELQQYEWRFDYRCFVLAVAFYGINFGVVLLAWHRIMVVVQAMTDLRVNARIYCYSSLVRRIPGFVWYIASRAHLYKQEGVARSITVVGTLLETMLMIVSGLAVYLLTLLFKTAGPLSGPLSAAAAALLLVSLLVALYPVIFNRLFGYLLRRFKYEGEFSLTFSRLAGLVAIYIGAWVLAGVELYILANAVYAIPLRLLPAITGACAASGAVSLVASYLVQGMGITEVTQAALLATFLPLPVAIAISLLFRILLTLSDVVWALVVAWGLAGFKLTKRKER